jgi:opacity protein-like surface antigen
MRTLHVGLGYQRVSWKQGTGFGLFNQSEALGLTGSQLDYFPYITGLLTAMGGMRDMGMNMQGEGKSIKPGGNASMTWIRGNHLYKFGVEARFESYPSRVEYPAYGSLNFSADQTGLPSTLGMNLEGGTVGFPYASFLLGLANYGDIGVVSDPRLGKHSFALYAQDSWKVSPRLTLEFGLRYDYQTYLKDSEGRIASFSPTAANPAAAGLPGAMIFEGSGTGRCNCDFAKVYRGAFAPRLGLAFQLNSRMTLRAGWGIMYGQTPTDNGATLLSGSSNPIYSTTYQAPGMRLSDGFPTPSAWPNRNPGQLMVGSGVSPISIHPDAGRSPMQVQWNVGLQTLVKGNVTVDISYVGSRGSHWESNGLANLNALTADRLESFGLDIGSADDTDTSDDASQASDRQLLRSTLNSSAARQRGFSTPPYASFPLTQTVAQSLRPFPQYGDIMYRWAPLGKTWYSGVQVRVARQFANGFGINSGFSYQKEYALGNENIGAANPLEVINGIDNDSGNKHISALSQPYVVYFAPTYTFPKFRKQKLLSKFIGNWNYTAVLRYASGLPIRTPRANSNLYLLLFQNTYANRKEGADLFAYDLDGNDLDPRSQFALKAEAWEDPDDGEFSTGKAYYTDYRFKRRPIEQMSLSRTFRIADKVHLSVRAEFQNVFNRRDMANPDATNAKATQVRGVDNGDKNVPKSGFGYVNFKSTNSNQRNGQLIIKLQF